MTEPKLPNRWLIAIAGILMQICLGAVYSWSVFVKPLTASEHWSLVQVSATFTIALACLGVGTMIGGLWQDVKGPRIVASTAGILYGSGFIISSFAVSHHSLAGLYAGYGLCSGLGMGMGYICPVATITKWFPDKRGLMTGAAVMGFGAGAVVMGPIAARSIIAEGVPSTFRIFGIVYLLVIIVVAQFHVDPPRGWKPAGWTPRTAVSRSAGKVDFTVRQALSTGRFWLLWLMLSLNTSAGIMIISQASPLAQQQAGMTVIEASAVVGLLSIFNATGRVFWAWVSDAVGRPQVYFTLFALQVALFFGLPGIHNRLWFEIAVCLIALCYGGGLGVMPSFAADFFGSRYIGGIYGWMLLFWGFAAVPSPLLMARVRQTTGTYEYAILTIGFVMLTALIFPLFARREINRLTAQQASVQSVG